MPQLQYLRQSSYILVKAVNYYIGQSAVGANTSDKFCKVLNLEWK